jgi:3-methyladenine DNA glycosylase AlkD
MRDLRTISSAEEARTALHALANPDRARISESFFKTAPGEYGEGDRFIGVAVPEVRTLAKQASDLSTSEIHKLLKSPIHEERLLALLIRARQFEAGGEKERRDIFDDYLRHRRWVNNWDLVDVSAYTIAGGYLHGRSTDVFDELASSHVLWDRRIAIVGSFYFIRQGDFALTLRLAEKLMDDPQDLMHKAVGWMLREVGKRSEPTLRQFLDQWAPRMPRTMLRYAIERFPEPERARYLALPRQKTK